MTVNEPDDLAELRQALPELEAAAEKAAEQHREDPTEGTKQELKDASQQLRWARWKLRGGTGAEPGADAGATETVQE